MDKLLHNVSEASGLTGLSRSTLYELMRTGALASVKVGSRRLIPTAELERFAAELRETQR
jgi:excisionase family DNA binding protein